MQHLGKNTDPRNRSRPQDGCGSSQHCNRVPLQGICVYEVRTWHWTMRKWCKDLNRSWGCHQTPISGLFLEVVSICTNIPPNVNDCILIGKVNETWWEHMDFLWFHILRQLQEARPRISPMALHPILFVSMVLHLEACFIDQFSMHGNQHNQSWCSLFDEFGLPVFCNQRLLW